MTVDPPGTNVGWVDAPEFDAHDNGRGHPEHAGRLTAVRSRLQERGVADKLERRAPRLVTRAELERVHTPRYLDALVAVDGMGGGRLDAETSMSPGSWQAAQLAAGALVESVERVLDGTWRRAFCSVRPPGHHARPGAAMGFCLLDNVAIGAEAALAQPGIERVAILDWDVHHGNGTQEAFWERGDVFFASTHQYPFYPGSGADDERGSGAGEGTTLNCPLAAGATGADLLAAWRDTIRPALEDYGPQLLLISAGFDADRRDPLAGLRVTAAEFEALSAEVVAWADGVCDGRVVSTLEGGYDLEALAEDVQLHVETLL